ncbi:diverse immunoglobulin domain-containing protein 3.1 isoform X1 [Danio aesculapii]|uniref:diverse immunoglobulin domain-containing protein 3.1 isoform X1 n=1 Tax=Danio aesculapii TaxID=1142201 RepID=UPI0024BF3117|nr:diverse immunoglobulin domain-containing protein 3.1 isoform X1 [Danio aesculapii]
MLKQKRKPREMDCKMADKGHVCLQLGLMVFCSLLKGTSGVADTHVFFSSGENVRLPCNNALSDCTSTTWIYTRNSETVELVGVGKLKNNTERLSLGSDCSLNIKKATKEDYGSYSCRQYVNGEQYGNDAPVYLTVLNVSPSPSQTEISAGRSVTLSCQLYYYYYGVSCDTLFRTEGNQLMWVNQAGENLMTNSRYQISDLSSSRCVISLTTTLLNEDHNREWRCQLAQGNQIKTSASFTVKYSASNATTVKPAQDSDRAVTPENKTEVIAAVAVVFAALAVVFVAVFWVVFKKRAGNPRQAANTDARDPNQHKENYEKINTADDGAYETITMSVPSAQNANEQKDDVTYSEVTLSNKGNKQDRCNETVTYVTIRETECAPQDVLYATVK